MSLLSPCNQPVALAARLLAAPVPSFKYEKLDSKRSHKYDTYVCIYIHILYQLYIIYIIISQYVYVCIIYKYIQYYVYSSSMFHQHIFLPAYGRASPASNIKSISSLYLQSFHLWDGKPPRPLRSLWASGWWHISPAAQDSPCQQPCMAWAPKRGVPHHFAKFDVINMG